MKQSLEFWALINQDGLWRGSPKQVSVLFSTQAELCVLLGVSMEFFLRGGAASTRLLEVPSQLTPAAGLEEVMGGEWGCLLADSDFKPFWPWAGLGQLLPCVKSSNPVLGNISRCSGIKKCLCGAWKGRQGQGPLYPVDTYPPGATWAMCLKSNSGLRS